MTELQHCRLRRSPARSAQPGPKPFAADRPGFSVTLDDDIGKGGAGSGVKQLLTQRDVDEHIARQALGCRRYGHQHLPTLIGAIVKAQVFITELADSMPTQVWPD